MVALVANREGGVGSAAKVFALGKKCARKPGVGEEGFGGGRRCRNDLGHEAATFGDIDLSSGRLPDPLPGVFVKFADGDRFHVSHCVTLKDTKQGPQKPS